MTKIEDLITRKVEAGEEGTEDYDTGRVVRIDRDVATVAWDSGVRTQIALVDLRLATDEAGESLI